MLDVTVGHEVDCSIIYLDQNGNPMKVVPTPDSAPVWTDIPSPADSLNPSADGNTCVVKALAEGTDTVTVTVIVSGKSFSGSLQLNIEAVPQVLTSVEINSVVV